MKRSAESRPLSVPEQAAEWYVELDDPGHSAESRRRFFNWLKRSPQHIEEFLAVAAIEQRVAEQSAAIADIVAAVESPASGQPVALFPDAGGAARGPRRARRAAWAGAAALAAAAGFAAVAALFLLRPVDTQAPAVSHRTDLGEQRSIALNDGSIVTLNTLSEVTVRFDDASRHVTLLAGEAMFEVARDRDRPFVVDAGAASVDVLGTKFSIYRKRGSTQIAVVEGTVNARSSRESGERIELHGGEGAVFTTDGSVRRDESFDLARAVAWTERRLVFENARLADVASEFNRYNRRQLRIEDPVLAERQVTTVVNAHDVSALVGFLELQPGVEIDYGSDTIRVRTESR